MAGQVLAVGHRLHQVLPGEIQKTGVLKEIPPAFLLVKVLAEDALGQPV
jgi:hypothetical protein